MRRRTLSWCAQSRFCRTPFRPTFDQPFRSGARRRDCRQTRWKHFVKADISNASPKIGRSATRGASHRMPSGAGIRRFLAFDFGAESGRAVLAHVHSGVITTEEVHRFPNDSVEYGGSLHWDVARLWLEVRRALAKLENVKLEGMGVDAWGVDYALLGEHGELLQNPYHYRDSRTHGVMERVFERVPKEEIYFTTGIQFMPINTLYQLVAAQRDTPELMRGARTLVTIPDLFHYWLTGNAVCEFTNATTTQLVNPLTRSWAKDLMERVGIPSHLPAKIVEPCSVIGT